MYQNTVGWMQQAAAAVAIPEQQQQRQQQQHSAGSFNFPQPYGFPAALDPFFQQQALESSPRALFRHTHSAAQQRDSNDALFHPNLLQQVGNYTKLPVQTCN